MNQTIKDNLYAACWGIPTVILVYFMFVYVFPWAAMYRSPAQINAYEQRLVEDPDIYRINGNTLRITFNSKQNDFSLRWLEKHNFKIISLSYGGQYNNIPIYIVSRHNLKDIHD
jgi:hypothetical protein